MAITLWFAAFIVLIAGATAASSRGRAAPGGLVARARVVRLAVLLAMLAAAAPWVWGGAAARDGLEARLREGVAVRLGLVGVAVDITGPRTVGWSATAELRLPGDDLEAGELIRIVPAAADLIIEPLRAGGDGVVLLRDAGDAVAIASRGVVAGRCHEESPGALALGVGQTAVAVACRGGVPRVAIAVRRIGAARVELTLLRWRGRFRRSTLDVRAGDVLQLGAVGATLPGVTAWEVPAPAGRVALLAVPADPTSCAAWRDALGGGGGAASTARELGRGACVVGDGTFTITTRPSAPDAAGVIDRGARVAIAIAAPMVLLVGAFAAARGSRRRAGTHGALTRFAVVAGGLIALFAWRLAWAHRIDVLRELEPVGTRVASNLLAAALVAASLAGVAVGRLLEGTPARLAATVAAWALWLIAALFVLDVPLEVMRPTPEVAGQVALSLLGATGLILIEWRAIRGRSGREPDRAARARPDAVIDSPRPAWRGRLATIGPGHILLALSAAAFALAHVAPRLVIAKLALAYAVVIVGHAALRATFESGTDRRARAFHAIALVPAIAGVAALDVGVALVIVGVGLALAIIVAGHDAVYGAAQAPRLGLLEREHARLVWLHALAVIAGAVAAVVWAIAATDQDLLEQSTAALLHVPLAATGVFVAAAVIARSHRRPWAPWLAGALAALALWGARDVAVTRGIAGDGVGAHRLAAVVDPGYALLRDDHRFVASASAWREAALPADVDRWPGQGFFGARLADPGVVVSVENDYLPVLIARERGIGGLVQTTLLLLALVVAGGATAAARLGHASRAHRARWLVAVVVGALCVYQPLAALGVLPLTGISWPGLGIDSPADLWLVVLGAFWLFLGGAAVVPADVDERIRAAPRLRRARRVATVALVIAGIAGVVLVARAGASALGRGATAAMRGAASSDARVDRAIAYAASLACPWRERRAADPAGVVPVAIAGNPTDASARRFHAELAAAWTTDRAALLARLSQCTGRAGAWRLAPDGAACRATFSAGWPVVSLRITAPVGPTPWHATCSVDLPDDLVPQLSRRARARPPRVRLVSAPIGAAAGDLGELITPGRVIRLRPGEDGVQYVSLAPTHSASSGDGREVDGAAPAGTVPADTAPVEVRAGQVVVRGPALVMFATSGSAGAPGGWRRAAGAGERVLDRPALLVAHQRVWLFRPPRAFTAGAAPTVDPLLADDVHRAGDRSRRAYVYGDALPELGWTNPFDVDHSLGLDGWVHAALAARGPAAAATSCGTLSPPPIPRDQVCATSPHDGVLECRVALQPELVLSLRALTRTLVDDPAVIGRPIAATHAAFVVIRGDTGELLAQGDVIPGRDASAYAPADAVAETRLIRLREDRDPVTGGPGERGESQGERADWSLPIAIGSTFKPIVARAAEQAFPTQLSGLLMTAIGAPDTTCKRRGRRVAPLFGHCPPTPLAGEPTTADLHDFLGRSPNWYMAALGMIGLGLGSTDARFAVGGVPITLADIVTSDLAAWPTDRRLTIADATGPIVGDRGVVIAGLRRTPLWSRVEAVLGRPLCTLGDQTTCRRAAARRDLCAARALPIATPSRDLRHLVALGPDRFDFYGDDRPDQRVVATREYFQLLRGSGVHPVGSLAQLTDAFGRVVYDPTEAGPMRLAASWFPAPVAGVTPPHRCAARPGRANTVRGADGGLCAVVAKGGTAHAALAALLDDPRVVIYAAKTGTIDSLAEIAHRPEACAAWNRRHTIAGRPLERARQPGWLACGETPPDDSLFVLAFGVVTRSGTIPITLGVRLQRGGRGAAARAARLYADAIADYLQ